MTDRGRKVIWKIICLVLLAALSVAACKGSGPTHSRKIVLAVERNLHVAPVWVAANKGYFKDEGVEVEIREFESGRTALRVMLETGGCDMATAAQTPVVAHSFTRKDYAIVGTFLYSDYDVQMLVRRDRGIGSPRELKGKTIGITSGSSGHFFLSLFLANYGLQFTDVKTIDLEATELAEALIEGRVDAVATWEPHIYRARKALGDRCTVLSGAGIYREDMYFIARKDFLSNNGDRVVRFLRAVGRAEEFIRTNRQEAIHIVQVRTGIEREILNATWDQFQFALFLDQSVLTSLEEEARWVLQNRFVPARTIPNYLDYVVTAPLKRVRPQAVSVAGR